MISNVFFFSRKRKTRPECSRLWNIFSERAQLVQQGHYIFIKRVPYVWDCFKYGTKKFAGGAKTSDGILTGRANETAKYKRPTIIRGKHASTQPIKTSSTTVTHVSE